jgi:hypothetical protein
LLVSPSRLERRSCSAPAVASTSTRTDLVSLGQRMVTGARRNGPVRHHAQRTGVHCQHTCSAMFPRQRIGSEVVAICLCSDKIKYNVAVAYIYMRYMVVTCYKNYGTPLNCTEVPVTCTGKSQALENATRCCVLLPLSRGADFLSVVFLAPQIFRPPTHRCGWCYFIGGFEKCSRLGFASSRMLLPWQ